MKAVILAGGEGTRLRPLTCNIPKPMVPVVNKPFLEHMLSNLQLHGVDHTILTVCYLPDKIKSHFGDSGYSGMHISYVIEETPLGTAGAVKNVEQELDDTFLVLNGDIFTDLDLSDMLRFHKNRDSKVTLFLTQVKDPSSFGVVELGSDGRVSRFVEKPLPGETTSNWINGGIYIIEPEILRLAPRGEFYMFEHGLFPTLLQQGFAVYGYQANPYWLDLGTPANYLRVHQDLLGSGRYNYLTDPNNEFSVGTRIHSSANITGPVVFGEGCYVGEQVTIKGPSVLGSGCRIDDNSIISGSILWNQVNIGKGSQLENCMIANGATVEDSCYIGDLCMLGDDVVLKRMSRLAPGNSLWPS